MNASLHSDTKTFVGLRRALDNLLDDEIQLQTRAVLTDLQERSQRLAWRTTVTLMTGGFLTLAACLAMAAYLSSRFRRSLQALTTGALAISRGRLDHRIECWTQDEFVPVIRAFNHMAELLQINNSRLEHLVELRTKSLRAKSQELEQELASRRILEQRLVQAQKLESIGTLAGGIAHEFNNMLQVMLVNAEYASTTLPPGNPAVESIGLVLRACEHVRRLVGRLQSFSRQHESDMHPVEFAPMLLECIRLWRSSLDPRIVVKQEIADRCGLILADSTQIQQVILNLGSNAVHALGSGGGNICVTAQPVELGQCAEARLPPGRYVKWTFADEGHGIAAEHAGRVFDPFFTTKPVGEGSGLGLAVVHGIVSAHGGTASIASKPGGGTTVTIYLPVLRDQPCAPGVAIAHETGPVRPG